MSDDIAALSAENARLRAELAREKAQSQRCKDAWNSLNLLAVGYQQQIREKNTSIENLNSTVGSMVAENNQQWALLVNAELKVQDIDHHIVGLFSALRPLADAMLSPYMQSASENALITLQLPDANIRTADGGDEPRKHIAILLPSTGVLQVFHFQELARFMQLLKHGHPELE